MPANTSPIFGLTPNVSSVTITTTAANVSSAGGGTLGSTIFKVFTSGANGSFIQKIRFMSVATTPTNSVATVLRIFISTISTGATTAADTFLIGELSVPLIASSNATNASNFYDYPLNFALSSGEYIHVTQHVAQTTNQNWIATAIGSDY